MVKEKTGSPTAGSTQVVPRRFPIWLTILWIIGLSAVALMFWFADTLNDSLARHDGGVLYFIAAGILAVCTICLFVWLFFFSYWKFWIARFVPAFCCILCLVFLVLFKPRHGGNVEIVGWEPRFWSVEPKAISQNEQANFPSTTGDDFWQFLGPSRNALVSNTTMLTDQQPKLIWKQPIGKGWSGFAAVGDYAVTMEQRGEQEVVTCYNILDGKLLWMYGHNARYEDPMNLGGSGPRSTPCIVDGRVYAQGGTGRLVCLNANDGKLIWEVDLVQLLNIDKKVMSTSTGLSYSQEDNKLFWGRAGSPLVFGNLVIVPGGGPRGGPFVSLIAFDRFTGAERWRGGEQMISYSSPGLARLSGRDTILILNENSLAGHDPETGVELWRHERPGNSDSDANCSQPIQVGEDLVLIGKGYGGGGELLRIKDNQVETVWKNALVVKTKFTVPVVVDGFIYCLSDGIMESTELMTGKRRWKKNRFSHGQLLLVNDKLLVHSQNGTLHLVQASPDDYVEYENFKLNTISGTCWNMLCLQNRRHLLVRSELEAALIQLPVVEEKTATRSDLNLQDSHGNKRQ